MKIYQFANESPDADLEAFMWGMGEKYFRPLLQLRDQEIAITKWLKRQSMNVAVSYRGALLVAKLRDVELWFWYYAIQTDGDPELIRFARTLGIDRKRAL